MIEDEQIDYLIHRAVSRGYEYACELLDDVTREGVSDERILAFLAKGERLLDDESFVFEGTHWSLVKADGTRIPVSGYEVARTYYRRVVWQRGMPAWENVTQAQREECYAAVGGK